MTGGALERTRPSHYRGPLPLVPRAASPLKRSPLSLRPINISIPNSLNLFISYFYSSDKYSEIVAVTAGAPALFNKSSSDDRPGPGICSCKYVEDAKAARSVRVWDRVPMKKQSRAWSSQVLLWAQHDNNVVIPSGSVSLP